MFKHALRSGGITLALLWFLGFLSIGLELVMPTQVGRLTDLFQKSDDQPVTSVDVNRAILLLLGAQLLIAVTTFFKIEREVWFEQSLVRNVVREVFARLLRFSPDFFRDREVESINTRTLEDTRTLASFTADTLVAVPLAVTSLLVFGGYMLWHNWFLGLCLIPLSLLSGYFLLFDRLIQNLNFQYRESWDQVRARCHEVVSGLDEIRNNAAFDFGLRSVDSSFRDYSSQSARLGRWSAFFQATGPFLDAVEFGALYWLGAGLCMAGSMLSDLGGRLTWGDVIRFMLVAGLFRRPVQDIAHFLLRWRMTRESARRVEEYLQRPLEFEDLPDEPPLGANGISIRFDNVTLTAPGGASILDCLSAAIPAGCHVGLVGYAGCGKSTALRLIVRGATPSSGKLLISDREVSQCSILSLAKQIGFVLQSPQLFNSSIRHNLLLGLRRTSHQSLQDQLGAIDTTPFGKHLTEADLDRELLETVSLVCFDDDVLQKSLDFPLPEETKFDTLQKRLLELRQAVQAKIQNQDPNLIAPFDSAAYILAGTIHENLLGPGIRSEERVRQREAKWVFETLRGEDCGSALLKLGFLRILSDQAVACRVVGHAPRMAEWFKAWQPANLDCDSLVASRFEEVLAGPLKYRQAIFELALETDAEVARRLLREEIVQAVIEGRGKINQTKSWPSDISNRWRRLANANYHPDLSLRENILNGRINNQVYRGKELVDGLIRQVLVEMDLLDLVMLAGLEYRVGENGKFLSGGQRQKVALARVLMKKPKILLLDEATASLDEKSQARIVSMLGREFKGRTLISISHRLSAVTEFDKILVLDRGRLVQEGTPEELTACAGPFQDLLSQREGRRAPQSVETQPKFTVPTAVFDTDLGQSLRRSPLFAELDGGQLQVLERVARIVHCPAGAVLFERGDSGNDLFVVCEGEVEFTAPARAGGDVEVDIIETCGPGTTFGELALFGNGPRTLGARAKTELRLLCLERETLMQLLLADPRVTLAFLQIISRRLAALRDNIYGRANQKNAAEA